MDAWLERPAAELHAAWQARLWGRGQRLRLLDLGREEEVVVLGAEPDGSLRVRLPDGTERRTTTQNGGAACGSTRSATIAGGLRDWGHTCILSFDRPGRAPGSFGLGLALVIGLALRLAVIASPLGEIDGDEAVVGLMARHIAFLGERPVFYWGQPYLGSLEAFSAAPLFRLFDSSTLLLKLVPTAYSLGFLALSAVIARRMFGTAAALATAAYLAVPPAMWAVWSTKARGGYAEILCLGQALLLVTLVLAQSPSRRLALLWGVLAGLALWTHLLAVVYLVPAVIFLVLARRRLEGVQVGLAVIGGVAGMAPLLIENLRSGFQTLAALLQPADLPLDRVAQFVRFFRVGVPVLLGWASRRRPRPCSTRIGCSDRLAMRGSRGWRC